MGDTAVYAIKVAITVAATMAFVVAITTLFNLVVVFSGNTVLGEIIALISVYLPFNAGQLFALISAGTTAILAFLVAQKVYDLTTYAQKAA